MRTASNPKSKPICYPERGFSRIIRVTQPVVKNKDESICYPERKSFKPIKPSLERLSFMEDGKSNVPRVEGFDQLVLDNMFQNWHQFTRPQVEAWARSKQAMFHVKENADKLQYILLMIKGRGGPAAVPAPLAEQVVIQPAVEPVGIELPELERVEPRTQERRLTVPNQERQMVLVPQKGTTEDEKEQLVTNEDPEPDFMKKEKRAKVEREVFASADSPPIGVVEGGIELREGESLNREARGVTGVTVGGPQFKNLMKDVHNERRVLFLNDKGYPQFSGPINKEPWIEKGKLKRPFMVDVTYKEAKRKPVIRYKEYSPDQYKWIK